MFEKLVKLICAFLFGVLVVVVCAVAAHYIEDIGIIFIGFLVAYIVYKAIENDTTKRK